MLGFPIPMILGMGKTESPYPQWNTGKPHEATNNTHLWIVQHAIELMQRNVGSPVEQSELDLLKKWQRDWEQGLYDADHKAKYNDHFTFASHFYDPDKGQTYIPDKEHAKDAGSKYFKQAGDSYQKGEYKQAFYLLGLSLHFFTDLTQPMHAANFTNLDKPTSYHTLFEDYTESIQEDYTVKDKEAFWNWQSSKDPAIWLHAAAVQAKKDFPPIVTSEIKQWVEEGKKGQKDSERKWKQAVKPVIGKRLDEAQRITAGYIHLWFQLYIK
jgi:phospholipase C